jgi:GNAT superfamily N-acetyltransferase
MSSVDPASPHYRVVRLPTQSPHLAELVAKYRDTKLTALKTDPKEWVQKYGIESELTLSVWHTRLLDLSIITLICVATTDPNLSDEEALLTGDWVGMEAALGPLAFDQYHTAFASATPPTLPTHDTESRWHIRDLFVSPAHRSRGIAMMLRKSLFCVISQEARSSDAKTARMRIIVNPKNRWLVEWDRRCGFEDFVMVTLKEGLVANGMKESVPGDTGSSEDLRAVWETRYGMCMERVVVL